MRSVPFTRRTATGDTTVITMRTGQMPNGKRTAFHEASWVDYLTKPRIPEGAVHLIIGDNLVRVLTRVREHWQIGVLSFSGAATPQVLASLEMQEVIIYLDSTILTICTVPYNMLLDDNGLSNNERVFHVNDVILEIHRNSILPLRLLEEARMMEGSLPGGYSSDDIHFDHSKGTELLNKVFENHINNLESELLETGQFTFDPPPRPPFFPVRPVEDSLGGRIDTRDSLASSRSRQPGLTSLEKDSRGYSTPRSSVVSSVRVVERGKSSGELLEGTSRARY